jgi:MraZ protein
MPATENIDTPATPPLTYNGQFTHGLDEKRRLQIPSRWRPESGEMEWKALLWPKGGLQGHYIVVLTTETHNRVMSKLNSASMADEKALAVMRYFSRNSGDLVMDKAGRVCLPENLAKAAGIEKEAVLVGMWERFEIWSPERFNQTATQEDAVVPMELGKYL